MNKKNASLTAIALLLSLASLNAAATTTWSAQDYDLYPLQTTDPLATRAGLLYVAKDPALRSGTAYVFPGTTSAAIQSWDSNYLGIAWWGNQYVILTADFNGDGNTDILMQSKSPTGNSQLLLAIGPGNFPGISQTIAPSALGITWTADQHKLHTGDFNGDGKADLFFQATTPTGTHAILYANSSGQFTSSPTQTWTNASWGSFKWATTEANIVVGDFGGATNPTTMKPMADLLIQAKPKMVMIDYDVAFPVPVYTPNSFGVVFSAGGATPFGLANVHQWSRMAYGVDWSPLNYTIVAANFDNSGLDDLLFQARATGKSSYQVTSNSLSSIFATGTALSSNVDWSAATNRVVALNFTIYPNGSGPSAWGVYLQAQVPSGTNYVVASIAGTPAPQVDNIPAFTGVYPTTAVGTTSGSAGVSGTGAATYTIPLDLPSGINGMTPRLALVHRSDSGAGLLGMSWNFAGISSIARCDATVAQNTSAARYALQTTDRYCLDGNQLKQVSNGVGYGLDGSKYRTELETYGIITAHGAVASAGPQSFDVKDKSGLSYEYGGTTDSRLLAFGGQVRSWQISRISDHDGNEIKFVYASDQTSGSMRPETITYTGRTGTTPITPAYTISFTYDSLASPLVAYQTPGGGVSPSHVIRRITLKYNGTEMRSWRLAYVVNANDRPNRPLLTSVQQCGVSDAECLAPVSFSWTPGNSIGWQSVQSGASGLPTDPKLVRTLDFNGDGYDDVAFFDATSGHYKVLWGSASGYGSVTDTMVGPVLSNLAHKAVVMDVDGNGKADLLIPNLDPSQGFQNAWMAIEHTSGTSFSMVSTSTLYDLNPTWNTTVAAADINGDGYPDIVYHDATTIRAHLHGSSGAPTFNASQLKWTAPAGRTIASIRAGTLGTRRPVVDFDADTRQDLFVQLDTGYGSLFATDTGYVTPTTPVYQAAEQIAGHFGWGNCTNALAKQYPTDTWLTPQSMVNCGRTAIAYLVAPITQTLTANIVVADYTGDGAQDVISYYPPWTSWSVSPPGEDDPNTGYGVQYPITLGFSGNSSAIFASDIDGDGLDDITQIDTSGVLRYARHAGVKPELMTSTADGFGNSATFTYQSTSAGHCTTNDYTAPAIGLGLARYTRPFYVVCKVKQTNGIGGTFDFDYTYSNPTTNVAGRGFGGFESRSVIDSRNGRYHLEEYSLDFPTTGMVKHALDKQSSAGNAKKIREGTFTLATVPQGSGASATYFPYVSASNVDTYEVAPGVSGVDGVLITNQTNTVTTVDAYGNITDEIYKTTDKDSNSPMVNQWASVRTQRTITNDTTNWCLGVPTQVQTTSTLFDSTARTKTESATVDYEKCRVTQRVNEPFVPALKVTTDFGYDPAACGNVSSINVTGMNSAGTGTLLPRQTTFNYGTAACRLPEQITDPMGNVTSRTYRYDLGLLATETDPNGLQSGLQYDSFGRVTIATRADGTSVASSYSSCNQANGFCGLSGVRLKVTSTERETTPSNTIRTDYTFLDGVGRSRFSMAQLFDGTLSTAETTYDAFGRVATQSTPYTAASTGKTVYGYDLIGRQNSAQLLDSIGTAVRSSSAAFAGRTTTQINPRGMTTTRRFDVLGQLRQLTDPTVTAPSSSGSTSYGYTYLSGQVGVPGEVGGVMQSSITDALSNVTKVRANLSGLTTQSIDPDRGTWKFEYDSLGELTKRTDALSNNLTFGTYDKLGRPSSRVEPEGTTDFVWGLVSDNTATEKYYGSLRVLKYTLAGQGTANYTETYKYDDKGRYKQTSIATASDGSYLVDYAYQASTGLLDTITYPQSNGTTRLQVRYEYQKGIVTSVKDATTGGTEFWKINTSGMDAWGNLTDEQLGNGIRVKSAYDPTTGLLSTRKSGNDTPATNRQDLAYLWDANGNLTRRTDNRQLVGAVSFYEQFNYDEIDRLSSTSSNAPSYTALTLTVNAIGNITAKSDFPGTYTYPASGASSVRPHAVSSVGSTNYGYDANGNMTSRGGNSITWTTYGVPSAINGSGGLSSQFTYTPNRNRWKQTATYPGTPSAETETTLYIGGVMEKVTRSGSSVTTYRHYISAGSSTVVYTNFSDATAPQTYYVTKDHVDSASVVTNSSGTIVVNESFDAFGGRRDSDWVGPVNATDGTAIKNSTRRGYTGHEHLDNLVLVHMNGRIQDPALGRFISADPLIPKPGSSQSLNRYSYVRNRPLSATDPSGYSDVDNYPRSNPDSPWWNSYPGSSWVFDLFWNNPGISDAYAIEGRANGAVPGLRPDTNACMAVAAAPARAFVYLTDAGQPKGVPGYGGYLLWHVQDATGYSWLRNIYVGTGEWWAASREVTTYGSMAWKMWDPSDPSGLGGPRTSVVSNGEMVMAGFDTATIFPMGLETTAGRTGSGLFRLFHGTAASSAERLLAGEALNAATAAAFKIDGSAGFFLATHIDDAAYFAARRGSGKILEYQFSSRAVEQLGLKSTPLGALGKFGQFQGDEVVISPESFDLFNSLLKSGDIIVTHIPY